MVKPVPLRQNLKTHTAMRAAAQCAAVPVQDRSFTEPSQWATGALPNHVAAMAAGGCTRCLFVAGFLAPATPAAACGRHGARGVRPGAPPPLPPARIPARQPARTP